MTKIDLIRKEMMTALKSGDKPRKDALSALLSALKAKFVDKRSDLTELEENEVVLKEIKQTKEQLETTPSSKSDVINECQIRIAVFEEFAPQMMNEDEIKTVISDVLKKLGISAPTQKEKGIIMKTLMPLIKGKADGGLVNQTLASFFIVN